MYVSPSVTVQSHKDRVTKALSSLNFLYYTRSPVQWAFGTQTIANLLHPRTSVEKTRQLRDRSRKRDAKVSVGTDSRIIM